MALAPKIQTETFYVDFFPFVVEFNCDAHGLRAFENPEIEIYSIDGKPEEMYSDRVIEKVEEEIRFHCFKDVKIDREFQDEAAGDELHRAN